ncbi:flavin reductase family protein [candidate division KSB1 bacterium]|nr:flavin reductase family protein [candidate division KSB1 bacterium]
MSVSPELFRNTLAKFCTGVTIVTTKNQEGMHGLTVNAFTSVSLDPPLILVCIQKNGLSHSTLCECEAFVVNILSEEQKELSDRFANPALDSEERFRDLNFRVSENGVPILAGNLGHLECRVVNQFEGGDHTIFIGQVENGDFSAGKQPLLFYESRYSYIR